MNLDFGRSLTYPFEDPDWLKKVGILFAVSFIPGLNLILWSGYAITTARNIVRGATYPLPDWKDWSDIAVRGWLSVIASFAYFLPVILLTCCISIGVQFSSSENGAAVFAVQCCASIFVLLYTVVASLLLNAGHINFALTDQFHSYVEIGARVRDVQQKPALLAMFFAVQAVIFGIAVLLSGVLLVTCLAPFAIMTMAFLSNGYVLGSAAAVYSR